MDWFDPSRSYGGHFDIVYSYKVSEVRYTGQFSDYSKSDKPLHVNDTIAIRYCPEHPDRSYYPKVQRDPYPHSLIFAIGVGAALIVFLIVYLSGGFR